MQTSFATLKPAPAASAFARLGRGLALLIAVAISLYGALTIESAISHYKATDNPAALTKTLELREASEFGRVIDTPLETSKYASGYVALLGLVSSPIHAFGKGSLGEHVVVYSSSPKVNGAVLALHIIFGSFCLIFGAFQFWPTFRRRHPKWHRGFGAVYIITVQISMVLAMVYLVRTPVTMVIDNLFFATGLWLLAITVTLSLWMSIYSLVRKQFAQHQAWMCINYGLLLATPLQRFGWLAFGALFPNSRWTETNYAVTGTLIPLSMMASYAVFAITRRRQAMRNASALEKQVQTFQTHARAGRNMALLSMPVLFVSAYLTVAHYLFGRGISSAKDAAALIPIGVIENHNTVVSGSLVSRTVFVFATLLGLVSAGHFLWSAFLRKMDDERWDIKGAWGLVVAGLAMGSTLLAWGIQLGLPSYATLAGGALSVLGGGVSIMFSVALAYGCLRGEMAWVKEWGVFTLTCVLAPSSFFLTLPALASLGFDSQFVSAGHLFRIAEAGQWLLLMGPFVYAVYGQATHQRIAR